MEFEKTNKQKKNCDDIMSDVNGFFFAERSTEDRL